MHNEPNESKIFSVIVQMTKGFIFIITFLPGYNALNDHHFFPHNLRNTIFITIRVFKQQQKSSSKQFSTPIAHMDRVGL